MTNPRTPRVFQYGDPIPADVTRMRDADGDPHMCWHRMPHDKWYFEETKADPAPLTGGTPVRDLAQRWFPMTEIFRWAQIPDPDDTVTQVHQPATDLTWTRAPGATYWTAGARSFTWAQILTLGDVEEVAPEPESVKVNVVLFKASGKYYTEEPWRVPVTVPHVTLLGMTHPPTGPYDMRHSPDFRRIDGGAVLVESQEPWGYPHLFPGEPA